MSSRPDVSEAAEGWRTWVLSLQEPVSPAKSATWHWGDWPSSWPGTGLEQREALADLKTFAVFISFNLCILFKTSFSLFRTELRKSQSFLKGSSHCPGSGLDWSILSLPSGQVASRELQIPMSYIHLDEMNTVTVPNTIATGGSTGADVNGRAVQVMSSLTPSFLLLPTPFPRGPSVSGLSSERSHPTQCKHRELWYSFRRLGPQVLSPTGGQNITVVGIHHRGGSSPHRSDIQGARGQV